MELKKKIQKAIWIGAMFLLLIIVSCSLLLFKNKPNQKVGEVTSFGSQTNTLMSNPTAHDFTGKTIGADDTNITGCPNEVKNATAPLYSWNESFSGLAYNDLWGLTVEQGNFFKKTADQTGDVARDGTSASTAFVISNAIELSFLAAAFNARGNSGTQNANMPLNSYFELDSDIDLSDKQWTPLVDIRYTQGTTTYFNGNGHKITGAYVDQRNTIRTEDYNTTSIFGCFPQGKISNLIIEDACIQGYLRAGIVARSYSATNFENILVKNSYVSSQKYTAGISDNASTIINCRLDSCEVTTLGLGLNTFNQADSCYVMGIGRSNTIKLTGTLENTNIIQNSIVHFTQTLNNYDPLTASNRTDYIYVYGVGCSRTGDSADIGNFKIANNKVFANIEILNSNASAASYYYTNFYLYVFGGYNYSNGGQNLVSIHDITMDNCFVNSDFSYEPTDNTKNGNMTFRVYDYVAGIARLNNTRADVTHYENLLVKNSNVTSKINVKPKVAPSGTTKRTFEGYVYVQGVFHSDNNLQKAVNCRIENSKVLANTSFNDTNIVEDSAASFTSTIVVNGVGGSNDMNARTDYINCSSENCQFDAIISETFKTDEDTNNSRQNHFSNSIYLTGIGRGLFLQDENNNPCFVKNIEFNAKSNVTRGENDSTSSCGSTVRAVGIGFNVSGQQGNFDGTTIEDATFNVQATYGTSNKIGSNYVSAIGYSQSSGNAYAVTYKDIQVNNVVINAEGYYNEISGLCYASKPSNGIVSVTDSVVEDLEINATSTNNASYVAGVLYSTSSNAGITINNVALNNVSITADAGSTTSSNAYVAGVARITGTTNMSTIQNNTVENCSFSANSIGAYVYASGLVYCSTPVTLTNNTVENCSIEAITKTYDAYAAGMVLQTNSTNGLNSSISNCYAIDNTVLAEFQTGGTASSRTVGAYGLAGYYIKSVDSCVVTNGTVSAINAVGYAYAEGIAGTWGASHFTTRASSATSDPLTSITNSYNFADVKAITEGASSTGASGIGQAEYIDSCVNYGKVMGNYVGGITRGFYMGSSTNTATYSTILIVKNCTNAGDVCRADTGGTSYIGGIVGVYYNYSYNQSNLTSTKFVLENNASMGGVYSRLQQDETYSQNLSPTTYLGTLYGFFRIRSGVTTNQESDYQTALSRCSIKNNYSLVEEDGFNGNLYQSVTPEGAVLAYTKNSPTTNYMASSDGVFYHDGGNYYEIAFRALYKYCSTIGENSTDNTNKIISSDYTDSTFAIPNSGDLADYAEENDWKQMSLNGNVYPQVEIELAKQVIMFSLSGFEGTTPNVILADIANGNFSFTTPTATLTQIGVSLDKWRYGANDIAPSGNVNQPAQSHLITFYATTALTSYEIVFASNGTHTGSVTVNSENTSTVTLISTDIVLTSNYTGGGSISAITWKVQKKDGSDFVEIAFLPTNNSENSFNLNGIFNSNFLDAYANGSNQIVFDVVYATTPIFTITFANAEGGQSAYTWSATVGGTNVVKADGTADVLKGSDVLITVTPNTHYKFNGYKLDGSDVTATQSSGAYTYTISNVQAVHAVTINVAKVEYALNINVVNLQNVSLPIDNSTMANLVSDLSQITVNSALPQLQANLNYTGYRFVGWKLLGMSSDEYLPATNGKIDANYTIGVDDFDRYIINNKFNITAVFQRQYTLNITMVNPYDSASYASTYRVNYIDENGATQNLTNVTTDENEETVIANSGSYTIDENTFVKIYIQPNKRVDVKTPIGVEFGGNIAYIYLTQNQDVTFEFEGRPLAVETKTMNVLNVEDFDEDRFETSLVGATNYTVTAGDDVLSNPGEINIANTLTLGYNAEMLTNLSYRFINIYLFNVANEEYDQIENNQITVDDSFFDNYVTDDGKVTIMLKVIKQYKVIITGENLVSVDNYTLGNYEVIVKEDGNVINTESPRYTEVEKNVSYILDTGLSIEIKPTVLSNYASFAGYSGVFETELNDANIDANATIDSDRAISLRFVKNTYNIETKFNAAVGGNLTTTQTFQLGDTIVMSYTPANNYQILDWTLAGKKLSDWNATKVGNTIKVVATEEFLSELKQLSLFEGDTITLENDLKTMMNPTMFYGLIGGGILIVILAAVITLLLVRQAKLKRAKLEQERKLNDIARKFNIAGMISDLKSGKTPDAYTSSTDKKSK